MPSFKSRVDVSGVIRTAPVTLTDAATITTDASLGCDYRVTLGGNRTLAAPTNPLDGQQCRWRFKQDATGGRTITLASGAGGFAMGTDLSTIVLSTTANASDYMQAVYDAARNKWDVVALVRGYL